MLAVFLDIDGVTQPHYSEKRYREFPNRNKIITELSEKHNIDYAKYHVYDVLGVYCDWNPISVETIRRVLETTGAQLIVSSDRRSSTEPDKMHDLLEIHDLGKYWFADNDIINNKLLNRFLSEERIRAMEIRRSLNRYSIEKFVAVDDMRLLMRFFPNNCVITRDYMTPDDGDKCVKILTK